MSTINNVLTRTKNSFNKVYWQVLSNTNRFTSTQEIQTRSSTEIKLLNFSDHEAAFRSKRTLELVRACTILTACSSDRLVDNAHTLLHEGERWLGSRLFGALMRYTLYAQFVAGETGPAVPQTARVLRQQGLHLMVAPALEADVTDASNSLRKCEDNIHFMYDRNFQELLRLAQLAGEVRETSTAEQPPCLQIKITGIVPINILIEISRTIQQQFYSEKDVNKYTELVQEIAQVIQNSDHDMERLTKMLQLECTQIQEIKVTCSRLRIIGEEATKRDLRLMVDMEWSYVNPMCSVLASALMVVFNGRSPVVCSTVQCYLKSALSTIAREEQAARLLGVCYGAKLVRGAYIERERQVAPDVVCDSYQDTGNNYNTVMESGVQNALQAEEGRYFLIVATHNEAAVHAAARLLAEHNATRTRNVAFAQIYGMAEHISLPLAQNGFCVYKSVAFGSLSKLLPYLARRAAENRAILQGARRERQLLQHEITRRIRAQLHF